MVVGVSVVVVAVKRVFAATVMVPLDVNWLVFHASP